MPVLSVIISFILCAITISWSHVTQKKEKNAEDKRCFYFKYGGEKVNIMTIILAGYLVSIGIPGRDSE